jgi:group II intron reverse transcriptase/maturase
MIDYYETKAHPITKKMVMDAYKEIKANGRGTGVDEVSLGDYAKGLQRNLYRLWNRLTSGSYFPLPVREKLIPKGDDDYRPLGICTVEDRIAQQVVKTYLEPKVEISFHNNSYGYRPKRNAHQAIQIAMERCRSYGWVVDLDIKSFFNTIDHELLMKAVKYYTKERWVLLYIERWLKAGIAKEDGIMVGTPEGTSQGSIVSPLLANIFLHFVFDKWMEKNYPYIPFERYCDDVIVHCKSESQATFIKSKIAERLGECKLALNMDKTHIVYCKNVDRRKKHNNTSFDFLGYSFRPRWCHTKNGNMLLFMPVMSNKAKKRVMSKIREMQIHRKKITVNRLASEVNTKTTGWINYYCKFSKWTTLSIWWQLNRRLIKWAMKYKKMSVRRAVKWLRGIYKTAPRLFTHWKFAHP